MNDQAIAAFFKEAKEILLKEHGINASDFGCGLDQLMIRETLIRPNLSVKAEIKCMVTPYFMPMFLGMSMDAFFLKMAPYMHIDVWVSKYSKANRQANEYYDKLKLEEKLPFHILYEDDPKTEERDWRAWVMKYGKPISHPKR